MFNWALTFFIVALIAALFGFGGLADGWLNALIVIIAFLTS